MIWEYLYKRYIEKKDIKKCYLYKYRPTMKAGQMIYKINEYGEQTPYIVYGVDDSDDLVFAIRIHNQTNCGWNNERIQINLSKIDNLCFKIEDTDTEIDGNDRCVIDNTLNKNVKHINKYLKKNGHIRLHFFK